MTEYQSETKKIPHNDAQVYRVLSDLRNLEQVEDLIPADKISDFTFDADTVSFRVDPVGKVVFSVVEREPNKLVKFQSEKLPFDIFLWVQLASKGEEDTRVRVTVKAALNPFIKGIVDKPLREVVDKLSDALTRLPYDRLLRDS